MFIASLVGDEGEQNDVIVYGRAVGSAYEDGRDDASKADIKLRDWKKRWPRYIRVTSPEFVAGTLRNGVPLSELMDTLKADAFASTQENAAKGSGNTDPRKSYRRQAAVRLSAQGLRWLNQRLETAFRKHGRVPDADLATLDWPKT